MPQGLRGLLSHLTPTVFVLPLLLSFISPFLSSPQFPPFISLLVSPYHPPSRSISGCSIKRMSETSVISGLQRKNSGLTSGSGSLWRNSDFIIKVRICRVLTWESEAEKYTVQCKRKSETEKRTEARIRESESAYMERDRERERKYTKGLLFALHYQYQGLWSPPATLWTVSCHSDVQLIKFTASEWNVKTAFLSDRSLTNVDSTSVRVRARKSNW